MATSIKPLVEVHAPTPLIFSELSAVEELGRPFEINLLALSATALNAPEELLAQPIALGLLLGTEKHRHFHGLVASIALEGMSARRYAYRLVLRPWFWLLSQRTDIRIFQKLSVDAILRKVLQPYSGNFRFELAETYAPFEYCVQYRETDLDFASRLMEQEGLYYHFEHEQDKHVMVITDHVSSHREFPDAAQIPYRHGLLDKAEADCITDWKVVQELRPTKSTLRDYDFEKPTLDLTQKGDLGERHAPTELETYDYPGLYLTGSDGQRRATLRAQEQQTLQARIAGGGDSRVVACGRRFQLRDAPPHGTGDYIVASTRIHITASSAQSGDATDARFNCSFVAFNSSHPFRPSRTTRKPTLGGPQTATVVGPAGQEIYTDSHGRVKLHFHWDRIGTRDENSSCWVRVAQPLAGDGFGFMALPRVGQEVVVDFLEGDPDRPLVTGRVYNGSHSPPYELPGNKTIATMKSRSSLSGSAQSFNELRFEDKIGEEYVWLQSQKDLFIEVENDRRVHVGNDEFRIVDRHVEEEIKGNVQRMVKGNTQEQVDGDVSLTIKGDSASDVSGQYGLKVTGELSLQTDAGASVKTAANWDAKVGANLGIDAAANVHIKAGANIVIEAGAMITLKAGGGSVVIGPANVAITGAMVQINSGGGAGSGTGASPKAPKAAKAPEKPKRKTDPLPHIKG